VNTVLMVKTLIGLCGRTDDTVNGVGTSETVGGIKVIDGNSVNGAESDIVAKYPGGDICEGGKNDVIIDGGGTEKEVVVGSVKGRSTDGSVDGGLIAVLMVGVLIAVLTVEARFPHQNESKFLGCDNWGELEQAPH